MQRVDKLLSHLGQGSRREVQALLRAGRVTVDGKVLRDGAAKVEPESVQLAVDGRALCYTAHRTYMLNKPQGVITATEDRRQPTVLELIDPADRRGLFAIGRLDKDTEGLLLLTDDGALAHRLASPRHHIEKRYIATCEGSLAPDAAARFAEGLRLKDGTVCRPARLAVCAKAPLTVEVCISEGRYHQVKRMLAAVGARVIHLRRVQIGGLCLDAQLALGQYRPLTEHELALLGEG